MIIRACAVLMSVLSISSAVSAQQDLQTYTETEVVVTATKIESEADQVPQPVTIISSEDIAESAASNVGEMLDTVPGVRVISAGSFGRPQGIAIRSLNGGPLSDKTLVLVDGRPVNDAWTGGVDWHAMPLEQVSRVEVIRGPGSALYGSQATAGVINVITKRPEPGFHGWLSIGQEVNASEDIDAGNDGYGRAEVSATRVGLNGSFGGETASHFVSLGYRQATEAFPTPNENGWDDYDLRYRGTFEVSPDLETALSLSYHQNTWDNQTDRTPNEDINDTFSADVSARWQTGPGVLNGRVYMNRADGETRMLASDLVTGETADRFGLIADYTMPVSDAGMIVAGVDAQVDNADITYDKTVVSMASRGIETISITNASSGNIETFDAAAFDGVYGSGEQSYDAQNLALFAQYTHLLGSRTTIVAGGRFDMHSEFGSIFNPRAGITYRVFDHESFPTTLKVNYGTAFRAPTMIGLFSQTLGGYGDPDLNPEKTKNTDIGIFQRLGRFGSAELTFFRMEVEDLMINDKSGPTGEGYYVFVPSGGSVDTLSFNQRMNLGSYTPTGAEFGCRVSPHEQVTFSGSYTYLDPGDFTFQTSKHRYSLGVDGWYPVGEHRIEAGFDYTHTGDGYFFDYEARPFDAFALSSARISFNYLDTARVSLHVKNLFDETYQLWHYAWQPGRTVLMTIETSI